MLGAIYIGLSGMNAYSKGLQTISNNVANLNSSGFKATTVSFRDMYSSGGGGLTYSSGSDSQHSGTGVRIGSPTTDFGQGDLRQSEGDLDLAIQGSGFLVLQDGDKTYYARTGQFAVGDDGFITLQGSESRLAVLNDAHQPVAVNIDTKRISSPSATTKVTLSGNLSSTATTNTISNVTAYDSRGGKHVWQVKFTAVGTTAPNEWKVEVLDENSVAVGAPASLKFIGSSVDPTTAHITITSAPSGADPLSVDLDFSTGVTSYSTGTSSDLRAAKVDGNGVGALTSVTVDEAGQIKLSYSNSKTELMGAVALADFRDPQLLTNVGAGLYKYTASGQVRLLQSGSDGIGTLVSKQIEASNVNLSDQFGDLILIQRGFQASSQVVSVANDMIQQLFGIRGQG